MSKLSNISMSSLTEIVSLSWFFVATISHLSDVDPQEVTVYLLFAILFKLHSKES